MKGPTPAEQEAMKEMKAADKKRQKDSESECDDESEYDDESQSESEIEATEPSDGAPVNAAALVGGNGFRAFLDEANGAPLALKGVRIL